ncbi:delta3,5-delta2,4-dienoyl-CoA isomerase [Aureococcus anophagefferens]|uniref:Delta3,5-delta2,4-dienoyl-CoA isomerase n=1 Tax=Aureococcus anophagefferens TaxID=44056 RepID=A0ABR1G9X2_AURAN
MAAFDGTSFPAKFVVPGRVAKGAIVRAGCELDTALVETCMPGTEMEVVEVGTNAKGTTRYRLVTPVEGWVSDKSVEYVPPPEAEPADPTDDLEAFMAQSPITTKGAVLFKVEDGVGVVTFNQPENNNALSAAIFVGLMRRGAARNNVHVELQAAVVEARNPRHGTRPCVKYAYDHVGELRVIFIKSAGRIWCAGGDPKDFQAAQKMESEGRAADNSAGAQEFANRLKYVNECPVPVVALVAGPVFGGGVGICSVCDMVVCTERAAFQLSEVKLGVIPATISPYVVHCVQIKSSNRLQSHWLICTQVVQAMGVRNARRYFTTGEPINAATAEAIGLVEVVKDVKGLEEAAQKICDNFTLAAPHAVAASKALVFGVGGKEITPELVDYTAAQLAPIRVQGRGVVGMKAALAQQKPDWAKKPLKVKPGGGRA